MSTGKPVKHELDDDASTSDQPPRKKAKYDNLNKLGEDDTFALLMIGLRRDTVHLPVLVKMSSLPRQSYLDDFARALVYAYYNDDDDDGSMLSDLDTITCTLVKAVQSTFKTDGKLIGCGKFDNHVDTAYVLNVDKTCFLPCIGIAAPYSNRGTCFIRVEKRTQFTTSTYTDARKFIADADQLSKGTIISVVTANTLPEATKTAMQLCVV